MRERRVHRIRIPAAVLLLIAVTSFVVGPSWSGAARSSRQARRLASEAIPSWGHTSLVTLAERQATLWHDAHPSRAVYRNSVRGLANAVLSGDGVGGSRIPVYVVVLRGHFIGGTSVSIPAGARPPRGRFLSLVVDARNGHVLDVGISNWFYGSLNQLGALRTLSLP